MRLGFIRADIAIDMAYILTVLHGDLFVAMRRAVYVHRPSHDGPMGDNYGVGITGESGLQGVGARLR